MTTRRSLINRVVLATLRSPLHRLLSGKLLALRVVGRRSGRTIELPVMYACEGSSLVVIAGRASTKRWWRNLSAPTRVTLLVGGVELVGSAEIDDSVESRGRALRAYLEKFPRAAGGFDLPWDLAEMPARYIEQANGDFVVIRVTPEPIRPLASEPQSTSPSRVATR